MDLKRGRSVAKDAAVMPTPGSTVDQIARSVDASKGISQRDQRKAQEYGTYRGSPPMQQVRQLS
jgi:hypothetical protein